MMQCSPPQLLVPQQQEAVAAAMAGGFNTQGQSNSAPRWWWWWGGGVKSHMAHAWCGSSSCGRSALEASQRDPNPHCGRCRVNIGRRLGCPPGPASELAPAGTASPDPREPPGRLRLPVGLGGGGGGGGGARAGALGVAPPGAAAELAVRLW